MADLILQCLAKEPEDRPRSMEQLREQLAEIYREVLGKPYRRLIPKTVELRSNALNNRAVSFLDLGQKDDAIAAWDSALKLDPYHPESIYNKSLLEWRSSQITDNDVVLRLEKTKHANQRATLFLGFIHLERAAADLAEQEFTTVLAEPEFSMNASIWRALGDAPPLALNRRRQ